MCTFPLTLPFAPTNDDVSGEAKDNIIFKFTGTGEFTLKIKNDAGTEVYSENSGNLTAEGGHYFYITLNPVNTNKGTESATWTGGNVTKAPAGDYTFTITQDSTTVLAGSFTVA